MILCGLKIAMVEIDLADLCGIHQHIATYNSKNYIHLSL
jgi:hypothetical protein